MSYPPSRDSNSGEPQTGPNRDRISTVRRWSGPLSGVLLFLLYLTLLARHDIDTRNLLPGGWKTLALLIVLALLALASLHLPALRAHASTLVTWLTSHSVGVILTLITLAAFGLRIFGISNNLPYLNHPDELNVADRALKILQTGDYNPHFFTYPHLYTYMQAALYVPRFLSLVSAGELTNLDQMTPPDYYLWGRLLTALLGTLTIPLVYVAARRLYNARTGLVAAAFIAANSFHILNSQFITTDVPATFFIALALLAIVHLLPLPTTADDPQSKTQNPKPKISAYLLAGATIGLAISTKYNSVLVIIPFLIAHAYATSDSPRSNKLAAFFDRRFWATLAAILFAFFITTPFALIDLPTFLNELASVIVHYRTGHPGHESDSNWLFYASAFLHNDLFPTLLTIAGMVVALARRTRADLLVLSFPLVYYLSLSSYRVNFERNMLPILPFTSILAALALVLLIESLTTRLVTSSRPNQFIIQNSKYIIPGLVVLALLPSTTDALRRGYRETQPDNRVRASQWLDANTRPGVKLWLEPLTPILTPARYLVSQGEHVTEHDLSWYRDNRYEYLVLSSGAYKEVTYDDPARDPHLRDAYIRFFDQNAPNLVASFESNPVDRPGPTILIYRTGYTPPRTAAEVHPQHPTAALFREEGPGAGTAQLLGADFPSTVSAGSSLPLLLYWTSNPPLHDNYTVFVHLIDPSGNRPAQRDLGPRSNTYPTSQWQAQEVVIDEAYFDLPASLPPGTYTLRIGLYLQSNFKSLLVSPVEHNSLPAGSGPDYVTLGPITIQAKQP